MNAIVEVPREETLAQQQLDSQNLRLQARQLAAAYKAVQEHFDSQGGGAAFNEHFVVAPTARFHDNLAETIRHGLITTTPNVRDEDLSAESLKAREDAVAIGLAVAANVQQTHADKVIAERTAVTPPPIDLNALLASTIQRPADGAPTLPPIPATGFVR